MSPKSAAVSALLAGVIASCAAPPQSPAPAVARCGADPARFQVRGDVTYDARTRLSWRRCPVGPAFNAASSRCDGATYATERLSAAKQAAEGERRRSNVGWRLPTIDEVAAIADPSCKPPFNRTAFPEYSGPPVWTSSAAGPGKVYQFDPSTGKRTIESENDAPGIVILVRD